MPCFPYNPYNPIWGHGYDDAEANKITGNPPKYTVTI
jgi:hypothetical protein